MMTMCRIIRSLYEYLLISVFFVYRIMNVQLGERSRLAWLGVEVDPLVESDDLYRAYNRPTESESTTSSNWFISKSAVVKGLLGINKLDDGHQVTADGESPVPKPRRKRVVRKVTTKSA